MLDDFRRNLYFMPTTYFPVSLRNSYDACNLRHIYNGNDDFNAIARILADTSIYTETKITTRISMSLKLARFLLHLVKGRH
jgi:hypothetical protein